MNFNTIIILHRLSNVKENTIFSIAATTFKFYLTSFTFRAQLKNFMIFNFEPYKLHFKVGYN